MNINIDELLDEELENWISFVANGRPPSDWLRSFERARERRHNPPEAAKYYREAAESLGVASKQQLLDVLGISEQVHPHLICLVVAREWADFHGKHPGLDGRLEAEAHEVLAELMRKLQGSSKILPANDEEMLSNAIRKAFPELGQPKPFPSVYAPLRKLAGEMLERLRKVAKQ